MSEYVYPLLGGQKDPLSFISKPQKPGSLNHRMGLSLLSDLYRPIRLATLYSSVYPGEYYNPFSGPERIHQGIRRFRQFLKRKKTSLTVKEQEGFYWIESSRPTSISLPRLEKRVIDSRISAFVIELTESFGHHPFSMREAAAVLGIAHWTSLRVLTQMVEDQHLTRQGKGKATKYRILEAKIEKAA